MENYKDYIEERVEIFPQEFKFGSFIRYEHCLEACKMAAEEASKNFIKPDVSRRSELLKNLYLRMIHPRTELHDSDQYFMDEITKFFQ